MERAMNFRVREMRSTPSSFWTHTLCEVELERCELEFAVNQSCGRFAPFGLIRPLSISSSHCVSSLMFWPKAFKVVWPKPLHLFVIRVYAPCRLVRIRNSVPTPTHIVLSRNDYCHGHPWPKLTSAGIVMIAPTFVSVYFKLSTRIRISSYWKPPLSHFEC